MNKQQKERIISTAFKFKSSTYEISNICNLSCEGCLYFSSYKNRVESKSDRESWDNFFENEKRRGVDYVYLAGAEPSLTQERIEVAYKHIKRGMVVTNGLKKIDPKIEYRIHISLWGDNATSSNYRSQKNNITALTNYKDDKRVVAVMTINSQNIYEIENVVLLCRDFGIPLTFNYFSPTQKYLNEGQTTLMLSKGNLKAVHAEISRVMKKYPETVIYNIDYNQWLTNPGGIYNLDKNGVATDCGNRLNETYNLFNINREVDSGKCCVPNIVCEHCRTYVTSIATYLYREHDDFSKWLEVLKLWKRLFL